MAIVMAVAAGCSADDSRSALERECYEIAEEYCCGVPGAAHEDCVRFNVNAVCIFAGGNALCADVDGKRPDGCVRSSVDFDACRAAMDSFNACETACNVDQSDDCNLLPRACISAPCARPDDGCAEAPSSN